MNLKRESGYILVVALIVIAILSSISMIGLRQFMLSSRSSHLDVKANSADYQALGALNRAWDLIQTNLAAGSQVPSHPLTGACMPPADPTETSQIEPATVLVHDNETGQDQPFVANQRAWIYAGTLCDPQTAPTTATGMAPGPAPSTRYYHFRYSWEDGRNRETLLSPVATVWAPTGAKPAYLPPTVDLALDLPLAAVRYNMYVAMTTTAVAPTDPGAYRRIHESAHTRQSCTADPRYRCLTQNPATFATPLGPSSNTALLYLVVAKGWDGASESNPEAQRLMVGAVLNDLADNRIYFDN